MKTYEYTYNFTEHWCVIPQTVFFRNCDFSNTAAS